MKRIKLKHGTARVNDNVSEETINALNKLSEVAYNMTPEQCAIHNVSNRFDDEDLDENEDCEIYGYYCAGCDNIQNDCTGFGCNVCGSIFLDPMYE